MPAFGRSLVIDPWGPILAQAADTEAIVEATLDLERVAVVRRAIPALAHRRPAIYAPESVEIVDAAAPAAALGPTGAR
jgi:predicted amidohydrolase